MTEFVSIRKRSIRRAFSFAEVMFAVIILGVGFIMIAAMFPVALRQSKSNADEASAAAMSRQAQGIVDKIATNASMFPAPNSPASVFSIPCLDFLGSLNPNTSPQQTYPIWSAIRGDLISSDDPRYAWVPFYVRQLDPRIPGNAKMLPYAQVTLICVQSTIKPTFDSTDALFPTPTPAINQTLPSNLQGRPVSIKVSIGTAGDPNLIGFAKSQSPTAYPGTAINAVAEGAFVIVRSAPAGAANLGLSRLIGQIYRVGTRRPEVDGKPYNGVTFTGGAGNMQVWELQPGYDFNPIPADAASGFQAIGNIANQAEAWIVGRSFANNNPSPHVFTFDGPAMDVAAYTTFIYCKP